MSYVITTLLPIFGLILLGFALRRSGCLGEAAASELNRFVVWLCLPALLFTATASSSLAQLWHPEFILVYAFSTLLIFDLVFGIKLLRGRAMADASIDGLGAAYANTGYVGIPLCLFVFGDSGLEPALIATLLVVCVLFAVAVVLIEVGAHTEPTALRAIAKVSLALLKNPLVVSPLLGGLWGASDAQMPQAVDALLSLLGDATTPCALVSLGAFLAHRQVGSVQGTTSLVFIKLVIHPLLAWVLAFHVFELPDLWAKSAVLLAALPTGTGPYMLAEYHGRNAAVVSRSILLSTLGSVVTLSLLLYLFE